MPCKAKTLKETQDIIIKFISLVLISQKEDCPTIPEVDLTEDDFAIMEAGDDHMIVPIFAIAYGFYFCVEPDGRKIVWEDLQTIMAVFYTSPPKEGWYSNLYDLLEGGAHYRAIATFENLEDQKKQDLTRLCNLLYDRLLYNQNAKDRDMKLSGFPGRMAPLFWKHDMHRGKLDRPILFGQTQCRDDQCFFIFFLDENKDFEDNDITEGDAARICNKYYGSNIDVNYFMAYQQLTYRGRCHREMVKAYSRHPETTDFFTRKAREEYEDCSRKGLLNHPAFRPDAQ